MSGRSDNNRDDAPTDNVRIDKGFRGGQCGTFECRQYSLIFVLCTGKFDFLEL